jgi:predicted Na+-dependent transporter
MKLFAYMGALALACVVVILLAVSAEAQTTVPDQTLFGLFRPLLTEVVILIVIGLMGWLGTFIEKRLKLDIEARHREAFQTALTNAAGLYLATGDIRRSVSYLAGAAAGAMKAFRLNDAALPEKIEAKAGVLQAAAKQIDAAVPSLPTRT